MRGVFNSPNGSRQPKTPSPYPSPPEYLGRGYRSRITAPAGWSVAGRAAQFGSHPPPRALISRTVETIRWLSI